ncbi:MAG: hypothetical protein N5P05_004391 (plasmid) [Chroococcopsis gigantea SAG 12.99]|jgi:hypothetical protein|nr:hypothetical protein [Chroococcopsis gigantea SAG 12.99]
MVEPAPPIDTRTAADIVRDLEKSLGKKPEGITAALVHIFARYCELLITRLNRVPDKNFLAFIDLLGASRLPPQPARVALTFSLTEGAVESLVPAGTQIAAAPEGDDKEPMIFETETDLSVTSVRLMGAFTREPGRDMWGDRTALVKSPYTAEPLSVFEGDKKVEHSFYIRDPELFALPNVEVSVKFSVTVKAPVSVQWEVGREIDVLAQGEVTLTAPVSVQWEGFSLNQVDWNFVTTPEQDINLGRLPISAIDPTANFWLKCSLINSIIAGQTQSEEGQLLLNQLPFLSNIKLEGNINETGLLPEAAFFNSIPLDVGKPFLPFGEKPKLGDSFYIAHGQAFAKAGTKITLNIDFISIGGRSNNLLLKWEIWTGKWEKIDEEYKFTHNNKNLTATISFSAESNFKISEINSVNSYWLRITIIEGNYGKEAEYIPDDTPPYKPAT